MKHSFSKKNKTPGYVYFITNKMRSVIYTGVTSNLKIRIWQHRNGKGSIFTNKYNIKYLVYFEEYSSIVRAIEREKQIKRWNRQWKMELIRTINPDLRDLWYEL